MNVLQAPSLVRTLSLVLMCAAVDVAPAQAETAAVEWILQQKQRDSGKQTVYLTADAIRIVNHDSGYEVIARAPKWAVVIYRPDNKLAFMTTMSSFHGFSAFGPLLANGLSSSYKPAGTGKIVGLNANKFEKPNGAVIWVTTEIKVAPEAARVMADYCRTPMSGIPLRHTSRNDTEEKLRESRIPMLETFVVRKVGSVSPTDFEYPKPKRWVKTQSEVLSSTAKTNELNSIMDDLGVGSKLGK